MSMLGWGVIALVGIVVVGLLSMVLVPNARLPEVPSWTIGQGSRGGLLNNIIGGI